MRRWRRPVAWLGVAGLVLLLGWVWRGQSLDAASWVAALLALFPAILPELRRFVLIAPPAGTHAEQLDHAADELAAAVLAQWDAEEKTRRLQDPWPLPVNWVNTLRPVVDHWEVIRGKRSDGRPITLDGEIDDIVAVFDRIPSRRLVVLGAAGSGKSVLTLKLTLALLGRRTPGEPVPVLLHMSTWNPEGRRLHDWLAAQLITDHPELQRAFGNTTLAKELVATGRMLPILDGLDEMPSDIRAKALLRVNTELGTGDPIVITSRADEYAAAVEIGDVLTAGAVVELQPLGHAKVEHYLEVTTRSRGTGNWTALYTELRARPDDPLHTVLSVPLMVSLARTAYSDTADDPAELLDRRRFTTREALEDHLLDRLIPTVYRADAVPPPPCGPDDANRWLGFLAQRIGRSDGDFEWWQLFRMLPTAIWLVAVGLVTGLMTGIVAGVGVGLWFGAWNGLTASLIVLAVVGVSTAGSTALRASTDLSEPPWKIQMRFHGRRWGTMARVFRVMFEGIAGGFVGFVLVSLVGAFGDYDKTQLGLLGFLNLVPVLGGVVLGLKHAVRSTRLHRPYPPDRIEVRTSGTLRALLARLVGGLPAGLAVGVMFGVPPNNWIAVTISIVLTAILVMLMRSGPGPSRPTRVRLRSRGRAAYLVDRLLAGVKLGLAVGLLGGVVAMLQGEHDLVVALGGGSLFGVVLGCVLGLVSGTSAGMGDWSSVLADLTGATTPIELIRLDRRATLTFVATSALTIGLVYGILGAVIRATNEGAAAGLAFGAEFFCLMTLLVVPTAFSDWAWYHWILARTCFPFWGHRLPRRLLPFLRDAHRRGVLRQAGGVYQFRHIRLLERLGQEPLPGSQSRSQRF